MAEQSQQPLLRELIEIPETVSTSDYVLRLADAVTPDGAAEALRAYVVTDGLRENFDEALRLIKSAMDGHASKAAYLHGSFGAGKSHFMAVLYALLSGNSAARARTEFDPVLTNHDWLAQAGRKFLLVPYHMLGAKSLEQRVLGGYVSYVRKLHPKAPIPQVYRTDAMFEILAGLRQNMGDDAVIHGLADGDGEEDEWGDSFAWTPQLLDQAMNAEEEHENTEGFDLVSPTTPAELRAKLVQDAGTTLLKGFLRDAAENQHGFISLDAGLSVIAEHAKSLEYDGLVLFLDELILWLTTLIHDQKFVGREAGKITNFVEGGDARRAIPVISFIARQRDLRELVGEEMSGAAETSIQQSLTHFSGRFETITLEDRNLPQIARARVLRRNPDNPEADAKIAAAFEQTKKLGPNVWDTLLGSDKGTTGADEHSFRLTYPFSPAFMDALIHISSALQRSRTGLKLMGQLLSDHRDDLRLGQLVPVGDLYPVIASGGDRPFVDDLKVIFSAADKLYHDKLRPYLLTHYNVTDEDVAQYTKRPQTITDPQVAARCRSFVGDNRLVYTLLLSALAPSVPAFSDLTLRRLGALNHGSVVSPFPGAEVGILKSKVSDWAARFPEIKETGTDANPGVRLELSGIDVDSVIANANANDNPQNREALGRRLLGEELGLTPDTGRMGGVRDLDFVWKGTKRSVEVIFTNVADRDTTAEHDLQPAEDGKWRIIVDLPWDEGEFGPRDDLNRLQTLKEKQAEPSRTVGWLPTHLSPALYKDFRRLVVIDKALADEGRFTTQYAVHLNPDNRERAKGLLESQQNSLIKKVKAAFRQAYGLSEKTEGVVELGYDEHFFALQDVPDLRPQIGQPMSEAIRHLAGKLLAHQFPAHPDFDPERAGTAIKAPDARTVFTHVQQAASARDGRVEIPAKDRTLMARLSTPLGLGTMKEAYFELSRFWPDQFARLAKNAGLTGDLSLVKLVDWMDKPTPRGLQPFLVNLVAASYAEMAGRVWVRGGTVLEPAPSPAELRPGDALRDQPRPGQDDWDTARQRFEVIFGNKAPQLRKGQIVNQFARQIAEAARQHQEHTADLVRELERHAAFLQLDETAEDGRLPLARRTQDLLGALTHAAGQGQAAAKKTVEALAGFDLASVSPDRYGTSIKQAGQVAQALASASWETLELAEREGLEGRVLLESLRNTARSDQRTSDLVAALQGTTHDVLALIKRNQSAARPEHPPQPKPAQRSDELDLSTESSHPQIPNTSDARGGTPVRRSGGGRTTASRVVAELHAEIAALADENPDAVIELTWKVID